MATMRALCLKGQDNIQFTRQGKNNLVGFYWIINPSDKRMRIYS